MPTLNYTTTVNAAKTVGEVQQILAKHGASAVATRYNAGKAVGLTFELTTPHGARHFSLPVDVPAMYRLLDGQNISAKYRTREHAEKVAWRVVKDWLAAQLALVDAKMATLDQVLLPYLHVDGEKTLYQAYAEREAALELTT